MVAPVVEGAAKPAEEPSSETSLHESTTIARSASAPAPARPIGGGLTIAGRVVSETGRLDLSDETYAFNVRLSRNTAGGPGVDNVDVQWQRRPDGRIEGTFAFDDLAPGKYRLDAFCPGFFPVDPDVLVTAAPKTDALFVIEDGIGWADLVFEVVDDESGAMLNCSVDIDSRSSSWSISRGVPSDEPVIRDWPNDREGRWRVHSKGYLSVEGDLRELSPARSGDRPRRSVLVRMVRGTEIVFRCHARSGNTGSPLADVVVYLDDVRAGVSDEEGCALAQRAGVVRTVRFEKPGWRVADSSSDTVTLPDPLDDPYDVVFERVQR